MSLGIGLCINQREGRARGAVRPRELEFTRTPKTGSEGKAVKVVKKAYRGKISLVPLVEIAFGIYFSAALWFAFDAKIYTSIPYLFLFQVGFLYVGVSSLLQGWFKIRRRREAGRLAEPRGRRAAEARGVARPAQHPAPPRSHPRCGPSSGARFPSGARRF